MLKLNNTRIFMHARKTEWHKQQMLTWEKGRQLGWTLTKKVLVGLKKKKKITSDVVLAVTEELQVCNGGLLHTKVWCQSLNVQSLQWFLGSNSNDKHGRHKTKSHCKPWHTLCSLQDAQPLRTGSPKTSSHVSSFPPASWTACFLASRPRSSCMLAEVKLWLIDVLRPHQQPVLHLQAPQESLHL